MKKNPAFRPIVNKFLPRLTSQIEAMDKAVAEENYEELAALAHWLKGSGGTVGFDVFTKPAAKMESAAKASDMQAVTENLGVIKTFAGRIFVPGNDDSSDSQKTA